MFGRVHSFPFVSPSPLGAEFFRLLTRAGLVSLADVSAGDSCGFFVFSRVGPSSGGGGFRAPHTSRFDVICNLWFSVLGISGYFALFEDKAYFRVAEFASKLCVGDKCSGFSHLFVFNFCHGFQFRCDLCESTWFIETQVV